MKLDDILSEYMTGTFQDVVACGPEVMVIATILVMLLGRAMTASVVQMSSLALFGCLFGLVLALTQWSNFAQNRELPRELFKSAQGYAASTIDPTAPRDEDSMVQAVPHAGMLVYDRFSVFIRIFLLSAAALVILLSMLTGIPDEEDSADFYTMLLGATLGMMFMGSANHLVMVFIAVEMASVPSYALAGFMKGRKQGSEAALKYVVYGGAAAGVMLYGISLLAGIYGTLHLPTLAHEMTHRLSIKGGDALSLPLLLGLTFIMVGFAFKLSVFPFHFWCPDVFEGAAAEIGAFLSVASKAAAVALLARFVMTLAGESELAALTVNYNLAWEAMGKYLAPTLGVLAAITTTFGNLAAFSQTNLKRMFAYSTIAHAGFMLMALVPLRSDGVHAALFYLVGYLFMNLGAFAVVAIVRNRVGSEELDAWRGLVTRAPTLTAAMCFFLLSLIGLPPLVGFFGKYLVLVSLYNHGWIPLVIVGALNTVFGLVYYLNVMRVMVILPAPGTEMASASTTSHTDDHVPVPGDQTHASASTAQATVTSVASAPLGEGFLSRWFVVALAVPVVFFGIFPSGIASKKGNTANLLQWTQQASRALENPKTRRNVATSMEAAQHQVGDQQADRSTAPREGG